ncbi:hypothetical protein TREMEDRAFT_71529 [Tremella mesenterica DSM 1558]|uniref:uncharacterized protein n=1 Tax=Tremella mesenterica (strain ATCC 24925 / CBS 8224 / DSM 1558 / NBRC 9311 / NRRL Y-6157 / RJB 2259-6 / UBC 559-6) TaxID=578456 RepID=UPI0003F48F62|nr:uncharacterized protein TREMEDRAFT_71529 [Tremella mesenterica DSM 1558]EIW70126.1 hypothetical protein TREMEDRAFT_71529 [Tremella mesenterica DSM 1558]
MSENERSPSSEHLDRMRTDDEDGPSRKRPRVNESDERGAGNGNKDMEGDDGGDDNDPDEEEEEDEEGEEDDEDDEDDDEEGKRAPEEGRKKKRRRKNKVNRFLELEAEVDDEDEEDEEGEDYGDVAEFIDEQPEIPGTEDDRAHRRLDQALGETEQDDVDRIVQQLKERHGRTAAARYNAESDQVSQRLLIPGANDPSLWQVRVKSGREYQICSSIFRKVFTHQFSAQPIEVLSCFFRDSLDGMIFLEARHISAVNLAIKGIIGVFLGKGVKRVPTEEMAPLLKIKKKDVELTQGMWVRMKRGKYTGDLAQVADVDQLTSGVVTIKFLPRIDLTPREKRKERNATNGKAAGSTNRPPAAPFQYDEVRKVYGKNSIRGGQGGSHIFEGDEYIDGFCYRDVKLNLVQTEDVHPTLEEVSKFSGDETNEAKIDLSAIADANKHVSASALVPGDKVEVHEGEQAGLTGIVIGVLPDTISIRAEGGDLHGQTIEVPAKSVRKRFDVGEHVKVLNGKNADVTGMVVEVKGDIVTLMSDQNEREVQVFTKDIRRAADLGDSTVRNSVYDLHDMIMLDSTTAAVIFKIDGNVLRVLDQNGTVRTVSPQQVALRRDNKQYAVATDAQGNEMRVGNLMKETEGENRQGEVINIFRSIFVFLFNRDYAENGHVFVARAQSLLSVTPKSSASDLAKMNPALNAQLPFGGASLMPPPMATVNKNRLVNTLVVVVKGTSKGLMGIIKDVQGDNARVELKTNNKTLTINLASIKRKDPKTGNTYPLEYGGGTFGTAGRPLGNYDVNPYAPPTNGGMTPGYAVGGRTPAARFGETPNPYATGGNPYGGGRTPAYGLAGGGRTPAAGLAGGKTPGWAAGGKTPARGFGDGGRTPAMGMNLAGGKTPMPHSGMNMGGRTPAPGMYGGVGDAGSSRNGAPVGIGELTWDWALDFRNIIVIIGPSTRIGTRNPLHFQRGAYDGKKFGYDQPDGDSEITRCVSLEDENVEENIPVEYLKPAYPDGPGQLVVVVGGGNDIRGQQRVTQYENDGQWMLEAEEGDEGALVLDARGLCRIWRV